MLETPVYVACLNLTGRRVLVVGDGPLAQEKVAGLRECGADVVATETYEPASLDDCYLVVAATDDRALAERIYADAEDRAMLVNVADVPDLCNFILPAVARRGPLAIAISTSGASPALAKRMRREAEELFDDAYAEFARLLDGLRPWAREHLPDYGARRDFFDSLVNADPDPIELLRRGDPAAVHELIADAQARVA
ncbi:MAG: bifunctional precorrin-2 dehydrogenase/sirohydrochlorin ferrochelatase [Actinomycetota bacterium]|nr:bifunctional precorrin-2 dehydrogenase/sirohydrochlorin ferrochelatase [Actinomycetota bacterium]